MHRNRLILLPLSNCYSDGVGPRTFAQGTKSTLVSDATLTARPNGYVHSQPRRATKIRFIPVDRMGETVSQVNM